jgi:Flp pilus assembly protein TadG
MNAFANWKQRRRDGERGQSLVEFALIFPIFVLLLIGLIEFAVVFSIILNVNYASRDAALMAAEVGDASGADCLILQRLDSALNGATSHDQILSIRIIWADANGNELAADVYTEGGSTSCILGDGSTLSVPYTAGAQNYPETARCTILAGCGVAHPGLDTIGVTIEYHHDWLTPLPNLVSVPTTGLSFTRSNTMRMEPVL